jgi:hypothetical protein
MKALLFIFFLGINALVSAQYSLAVGPSRFKENLCGDGSPAIFLPEQLFLYSAWKLQADYSYPGFRTYLDFSYWSCDVHFSHRTDHFLGNQQMVFYNYDWKVSLKYFSTRLGAGPVFGKQFAKNRGIKFCAALFIQFDRRIYLREYDYKKVAKYSAPSANNKVPDTTPFHLLQYGRVIMQSGIDIKSRVIIRNIFVEWSAWLSFSSGNRFSNAPRSSYGPMYGTTASGLGFSIMCGICINGRNCQAEAR